MIRKKTDEDDTTVSLKTGDGETIFEGTSKQFSKHVDRVTHALKGHNRVGGIAVEQLQSIIARIEKLTEEKAAIAGDIGEVFAEAKGNGFDIKAIRRIIQIRKQDAAQREEDEAVLDTYMRALGMLPQLDLFEENE